eukprot:7470007-Ditylum_brightwellii.AAC.1
MIDESPLVWKWRWVKGHQGEKKRKNKWKGVVKRFIGPLDRWATFNVAMDSAGVLEEYMAAAKPPPSNKVSTNLGDELKQIIEGNKIIKYWTNHFIIPSDAVKEIDWPT